jgi:hypothetical protein
LATHLEISSLGSSVKCPAGDLDELREEFDDGLAAVMVAGAGGSGGAGGNWYSA